MNWTSYDTNWHESQDLRDIFRYRVSEFIKYNHNQTKIWISRSFENSSNYILLLWLCLRLNCVSVQNGVLINLLFLELLSRPRQPLYTFPSRVNLSCPSLYTVPSSMDRTRRCNKVDAVRLYASYRLNLFLPKGQIWVVCQWFPPFFYI